MQMQSTYWLEKVLRMIPLNVNALLCALQHIVMQFSGVNSENMCICDLLDGWPVFRAPFCIWNVLNESYIADRENVKITVRDILLYE
jgi:hypothetical protein